MLKVCLCVLLSFSVHIITSHYVIVVKGQNIMFPLFSLGLRGEGPMHPTEGKFQMEAERENVRPRAPTEELFDREEEAQRRDFQEKFQPPERREDLRREFESGNRNFDESESYRDKQFRKEESFGRREREEQYGGGMQKFESGNIKAMESREDEWLYAGEKELQVSDSRMAKHRFEAGGGVESRGSLERREKPQEQLYHESQYGEDFERREKPREHVYHEKHPFGEGREALGLERRETPQEQGYRKEQQFGEGREALGLERREKPQEQGYRKEQQFGEGEPESRLERKDKGRVLEHHFIAEERELEREKHELQEARKRATPTVPSLRKEPTVIPGLGELGNVTSAGDSQNREPNLSKQEKETKEEGQGPTNQVIESLGKIVSQLQTLQGLTSSLQLLQTLPKGQESASKETEKAKEVDSATQREKELSEETKRKVEALLANESDSEGEQVKRCHFFVFLQ